LQKKLFFKKFLPCQRGRQGGCWKDAFIFSKFLIIKFLKSKKKGAPDFHQETPQPLEVKI